MGLAKRRRVLFVSPVQIHERLTRFPRWKRKTTIGDGRRLRIFSPLVFSGEYRWPFVFRLNRILIASELRWMLRREGDVVFCANTPLAESLISKIPASLVIYDVMDDFASFNWAPGGAARMHERLLGAANVVFTGTYTLREAVGGRRPDAVFVPCGVRFDRFARPVSGPLASEPSDIRDLPRPLIGFVGTLSDRTDTEILSILARRAPDASIVLIGPVYRSMGEPPRAPNIHYLGLKKHEELAPYLHRFKVALLPFRLTAGSLAVNPVKVLEYLAAGCMVVSTRIPDVERFYSDVALIADSPDDFADKVIEALRGDHDERIREGIDLARPATWERMVEEMERLIAAGEKAQCES